MFLVLKKRSVIVMAIVLSVVICAGALAGSGVIDVAQKSKRLVPIYEVETTENYVALTFDAAWGSDKTQKIMDELEKNGYQGTFFLTGFWVDANPELVKEIHNRGHLIGNHSENHAHLSDLNAEKIDAEIDTTATKIEALIGYKPGYFRAPFGEYDNRLIESTENRGVQCIQWSIDSLDWKGISGGEIAERVVNNVEPGDIVLFHNNSDHILDALPLILLAIKNKGLKAVRMDQLVYKDNYAINAQGKQIKNK